MRLVGCMSILFDHIQNEILIQPRLMSDYEVTLVNDNSMHLVLVLLAVADNSQCPYCPSNRTSNPT